MGSFYLNVILKHKWAIPNLKDYLVREKVKCIKLTRLIQKYKIKKIDLLSIDAEGYDYEVIKQLDFRKTKPNIIIYEHKHLSEKDRNDCERVLKENRYNIIKKLNNTLAYLNLIY